MKSYGHERFVSTGAAYSLFLCVLAFLHVLCVEALDFVRHPQNLTTESAEKNEGTETPSPYGPVYTRDRNFLIPSGLRITGIERMKLDMVKCARMRIRFA